MSPFTYAFYDLVTGRYLGTLPLKGVSFGSQLLNPGTFNGTIDIASWAVRKLGPNTITTPMRTALMVDYLGTFVWGGAVWPRQWQFGSTKRQYTIGATELWSIFNSRAPVTDYSAPPYSGITGPAVEMAIWDASGTAVQDGGPNLFDPVLIAWQMLHDCLSVPGANYLGGMGVLANGFATPAQYLASGTNTPEGNYDSVNYPYSSIQQLGMLINQLATNGWLFGFDYAVDVAGSAGNPVVATINLSYPRRGRLYAQNGLVMDCSPAISYNFPEDGTQSGTIMYEQGSSGSLSVAQNQNALDAGFPWIEQIKSRANITSPNMESILSSLGASDLAVSSYAVTTPSVTFDLFNGPVTLGEFIVGDDVRVMIPKQSADGSTFDPRFPNGMDQEWRIQGYHATVADDGESTIQFTLGTPPSENITSPPLIDVDADVPASEVGL